MSTTGQEPETRTGLEENAVRRGQERLHALLREAAEREATDLHLKPLRPPLLRVGGKLVPTSEPALTPGDLECLIEGLVPENHRGTLIEARRVEFGYSVPGASRFRAAVYFQRGSLVATFRRLPWKLPGFAELGLPSELQRIAGLSRGLVLIAGPAGSGRSTTLAAIVREIADKRLVHVMTLEKPIEHPLRDGMGTVTQLEVGADTPSFALGIQAALSEDTDVIAIDGPVEPEDRLRLLDAADSGRLVLLTRRAETAARAVTGFLDEIPAQWRRSASLRMAETVQASLALRILDRADGSGSVPAVEILWRSTELEAAIAQGEAPEAGTFGRLGDACELDASLARLVEEGVVTRDEALVQAPDPRRLERRLAGDTDTGDVSGLVLDPPAPAAAPEHGEAPGAPGEASEIERLRALIETEARYDELKTRCDALTSERDHRIEELERKLDEQQRRGAELTRQLERLTAEKEEILHAVEREAERLEREEEVQRKRLEELEAQLQERGGSEDARAERIEMLERERRRTVEMVEEHCREYEQRIARLQERLRAHGIDPR